ncbi:hypothetical protein L3X37_01415 [Sabulilitoribacter arenilitoris]|uniref:DUF6249 domain-containing protein n=1 Tax=Wocania arenilitoris TaxID=2044858 RepID=A0AAE3JJI3_9FLAO|nr:DUF6249 domain-containing protein [Wocania arenilitoris]MCF7567023.1 hypothetical protein [Wocania arenilitoris]
MEGILIPISFFIATFGVIYLYLSTRNKERLALIEKGADASIFNYNKRAGSSWKVIVLNLAFLSMGIGLGVFIASVLESYTTLDSDAIYPALIFFMAGVGLYVGFTQTKKHLDKE